MKLTPELFTTDRIYLDPVLNINMSAMRYQNWMRDLVGKEDTKLIIIKYRKKSLVSICLDVIMKMEFWMEYWGESFLNLRIRH